MKQTILVADDDHQVLELMKKYLETSGYHVFTSPDGWECMRAVMEKSPDLVILDLNMPNLDGLHALDMLKLIRITKELPIILYSGEAEEEIMANATKLGADDFMHKPFSIQELGKKVKNQLLQLEESDIQELVKKIEIGAPQMGLPAVFDSRQAPAWKAYEVVRDEMEFCVCIRQGLSPDEALRTKELRETKIRIFQRLRQGWKQRWPHRACP